MPNSFEVHENINFFKTDKKIRTVRINSKYVKRKFNNIVLLPKEVKKDLNLVFILSGFTGNGTKSFNVKPFDLNYPESIEAWEKENKSLNAIYVFVDAWSDWGGSQFINSEALGSYEDYIIKELYPLILKEFPVKKEAKNHAVMGGSSGGYGALHLGSKYPEKFGHIAAIAPDSFFDASLLPEIYTAYPLLEKMGGLKAIRQEINESKFFRRKASHTILNAVAMGLCYSANKNLKIEWPIDKDGVLNKSIWKKWLKYDPIYFLKKRKSKLLKLESLFIETGKYDQFQLQYGSRQIHSVLKSMSIKHHYKEFNGTHFDLASRRPEVWSHLSKKWK